MPRLAAVKMKYLCLTQLGRMCLYTFKENIYHAASQLLRKNTAVDVEDQRDRLKNATLWFPHFNRRHL